MINEKELKDQITKNLVYFRKKAGMTQLEAANKLSYSDKAISKWERGLGIPDVLVLAQIADIYGVTLSDLLSTKEDIHDNESIKEITEKEDGEVKKHRLISFIAVGLVWLFASVLFVTFKMIFPEIKIWYIFFVFSVPASFIIALVFNIIWGKAVYNSIYESLLSWTLALSMIIFVIPMFNYQYIWYLLLVPLTFQAIIIAYNVMLSSGRIKTKKK